MTDSQITDIPSEPWVSTKTLSIVAAETGLARFLEAVEKDHPKWVDRFTICYMNISRIAILTRVGDDAVAGTATLAPNKAYTALSLGRNTDGIAQRMHELDVTLASYGDPRYTDFKGGVLLTNPRYGTIGAVGISGLTPDEDNEAATLAGSFILAPFPEYDMPALDDAAEPALASS